jgi:hypothetical protein
MECGQPEIASNGSGRRGPESATGAACGIIGQARRDVEGAELARDFFKRYAVPT